MLSAGGEHTFKRGSLTFRRRLTFWFYSIEFYKVLQVLFCLIGMSTLEKVLIFNNINSYHSTLCFTVFL